jgi:hypothetical protein
MRQETNESQIKKYLAGKRKFDRLRRKSRLRFDRMRAPGDRDQLFRLIAQGNRVKKSVTKA